MTNKTDQSPWMSFTHAATLIAATMIIAAAAVGAYAWENPTNQQESLDIRCARAHLELAKLDHERALSWNEKIPGLFSQRTIDFLRKHVEIDQEQLNQALKSEQANTHEVYVRTAKAALDLAEREVARRQADFKNHNDRHNSLELDRSLAGMNAAELNLERTLEQADSPDTISYQQWQIEELRNQILELHIKVEVASRR